MAKLLLHPDSDIEFQASPAMILGPFDVYDREESLGRDLNAYDPNDSAQLRLRFKRWQPHCKILNTPSPPCWRTMRSTVFICQATGTFKHPGNSSIRPI